MCVMKKGKHKSDTEIIILYKTICDVFWAWDIIMRGGRVCIAIYNHNECYQKGFLLSKFSWSANC